MHDGTARCCHDNEHLFVHVHVSQHRASAVLELLHQWILPI